ncbi:MAG: hypothetical protein K2I23_04620, partial [Clostridia bacterium]|nr:hypothetical protein [Clostridia bacterium]
MTKTNRKIIFLCQAIVICIALILVSSIVFIGKTDDTASAYATLPSGAINNLYDSNKEVFIRDNLDAIAKKASYSDIDAMIKGVVTNGDVKNSTGFGSNTTIKLGTYYNLAKNAYEDLVWIPVYLAKDKDGKNAVLTLWLASVDTTGQASKQERSTWTDGTYAQDYTTQQNGMVCNSYDGSYIRNVTLNNGSSYLGNWGQGTAVAPPDYPYPTKDKTKNKFVDFTTGDLSDFIVTPSQVPWQMAQDMLQNDPSWQGSKVNSSYTDKVLNCYPTSWTQDKIWLPAMDDLFEHSSHTCKDLWKCSKEQKTIGHRTQADFNNGDEDAYSKTIVYTRNGGPNQANIQRVCSIYEELNEVLAFNVDFLYLSCAVRPAIHLNLNAALAACAIDAPKDVSVSGYTGLEQDFSSLTTAPDWYAESLMSVAFEDGSTGKIENGEYDMIATIKKEAAEKGLKFKGDPGAGETETSRKFKFKIPKKKIVVT